MKKVFPVVSAALLFFYGCASKPTPLQDEVNNNKLSAIYGGIENETYSGTDSYNPGKASGFNSASNGDYFNDPTYGQNVQGGPRSAAKDRVIYFSYDSANLDPRSENIIREHAKYLVENPNTNILLEGHTDSRGSRNYNLSLGERRAQKVGNSMVSLGVSPSQIRVLSYGEENPAVVGYNENAYQKNRRVVIHYK